MALLQTAGKNWDYSADCVKFSTELRLFLEKRASANFGVCNNTVSASPTLTQKPRPLTKNISNLITVSMVTLLGFPVSRYVELLPAVADHSCSVVTCLTVDQFLSRTVVCTLQNITAICIRGHELHTCAVQCLGRLIDLCINTWC